MTLHLNATQLDSIEREAKEAGVLSIYRGLLRKGQTPRMALMFAMQAFPAVNGTDAKFNRLERERMSEMGDKSVDDIVQIARKSGINTTGKTYNGQLGTYTDPHAWVSGTSDVRATAKAKGLSLRGQVNVENEPKRRKPKKLSNRLIREAEGRYVSEDPALAERVRKSPKARRELREQIVEKHSGKKSV